MAIEKLKPMMRARSVRVAERTRLKSSRASSSSSRRMRIAMPARMESQSTRTEVRKTISGKFIGLIISAMGSVQDAASDGSMNLPDNLDVQVGHARVPLDYIGVVFRETVIRFLGIEQNPGARD